MKEIDIALRIATKVHADQETEGGEAFILHPLAVGLMGSTDEERATGILHHVLECSNLTPQDLLNEGLSESIVSALLLLKRNESESYAAYVQCIIKSRNPIALRVKHNDISERLFHSDSSTEKHQEHAQALELLKQTIEDSNKVRLYLPKQETDFAVFAAGCFWGVQHYLQKQEGVLRTLVGYTGGSEDHPTYDSVRSHKTHHLEAVLVEFCPNAVSFETLCKLFFEIHDPGQTDGQGPDKGEQYMSGVFCANDSQRETALALASSLRDKGYEVNTRIEKFCKFWIAEDYHQNYYENTGGSPYCHVRVRKF